MARACYNIYQVEMLVVYRCSYILSWYMSRPGTPVIYLFCIERRRYMTGTSSVSVKRREMAHQCMSIVLSHCWLSMLPAMAWHGAVEGERGPLN